MSPELLLLLVAAGLYLFDSALLLFHNEGLLLFTRNGFRIIFGSEQTQLMGRSVYVPNPLTPHRPMFRLMWNATRYAPCDRDTTERLRAIAHGLAGPGALCACELGLLFVALPVCLFFSVGRTWLVATVALLYSYATLALVALYRHRHRLGIDGKRFASLAFQTLVCIPCAINLVRKVSLFVKSSGDLVSVSEAVLDESEQSLLKAEIDRRVGEELEDEIDMAQRKAMERFRDYLLHGAVPNEANQDSAPAEARTEGTGE